MSFGDEKYAPGKGRLTYGSYLKVPELLALQQALSDPEHHDELLFITIHQVYELWFKQILHELDSVIKLLTDGDVWESIRLLRRCIEIQRILVSQIQILETMTPHDFLAFRDRLQPASGFQSAQFRQVEFLSGAKNRAYLSNYTDDGESTEILERRLQSPTLVDAFYDLLRARGFDLPRDEQGLSETDKENRNEIRTSSLSRLYSEAKNHYDLYMLAEALIEYDENFLTWRDRHVRMVERMIGSKRGTGGSEGAEYLRRTLDKKFFPELWHVRTYLNNS
ncbi:MAG TPA: tryptophan 2,3-dioxygenase family protein [Blastocatellia bacterium]|nr:tryptophan 2,3-dioxygenase family protein [Blastocatellia bacterium]